MHACLEHEFRVCEAKWEHVDIGLSQKCLCKANKKCLEEYGAQLTQIA